MSMIKRHRERFRVLHVKANSTESACEHMTRIINSGGEILNILPETDPVEGKMWNIFYVTLAYEGEIIEGLFETSLNYQSVKAISG